MSLRCPVRDRRTGMAVNSFEPQKTMDRIEFRYDPFDLMQFSHLNACPVIGNGEKYSALTDRDNPALVIRQLAPLDTGQGIIQLLGDGSDFAVANENLLTFPA